MKRAAGIILLALFFSNQSQANSEISEFYGAGLCAKPNYKCIKVQRNESWQKLFPNEEQRDLVQRLNRSDTYLYSGKVLAVPANLDKVNLFDVSPFPLKIKAPNEKLIMYLIKKMRNAVRIFFLLVEAVQKCPIACFFTKGMHCMVPMK